MKLIEVLMEKRKEAVKIGTVKGNAFLYCGRVDDSAVEALDPYLKREVVEVFKNSFGGFNVIIAGNESGKFWTSAECTGEDLEDIPLEMPKECCKDLARAIYTKSAGDMAEALIGLKADKERTDRLREEYQKALKDFDDNLDVKHITKFLNALGDVKRKLAPLEYMNICRKSKIESEKKFIKSGAYCISQEVGEAIVDKIRAEVAEAAALVEDFIASGEKKKKVSADRYVADYVQMYCKEKGVAFGNSALYNGEITVAKVKKNESQD